MLGWVILVFSHTLGVGFFLTHLELVESYTVSANPNYSFDQRLLADEPLWSKPAKFEISVIVHFITLAVLASLLSLAMRSGVVWKPMSYGVVAAGIFEVMYIFLQAARGRESHFNISTDVEAAMYGLMGLGADADYCWIYVFTDRQQNYCQFL